MLIKFNEYLGPYNTFQYKVHKEIDTVLNFLKNLVENLSWLLAIVSYTRCRHTQ